MSLLKHILNEITQEQKWFLDDTGFDIIEHVSLDDYDLILLYHPTAYGNELKYTVGFQRKGRNFIDPFDQHQKEEIDGINFKDLIQIPKIIKRWVNEHGKLIIGSFNDKKTKLYETVFKRYKFAVRKKSIMGINALIIS